MIKWKETERQEMWRPV